MTQRHAVWIAWILFACSACVSRPAADRLEVLEHVEQFGRAFAAADVDRLAAMPAPGYVHTNAGQLPSDGSSGSST